MPFDTVVFGRYIVGTGFTDGDSLSTGGFIPYIVPTENIGSNPLDVGITYIDQSDNPQETTLVTTNVPAYTTAGTHIRISLNEGDSGIRDLIDVSVIGGTDGDEFNIESWNEGFYKTFELNRGTDTWTDTEYVNPVPYNSKIITMEKNPPFPYLPSNPKIMPINLNLACHRLPISPCPGGDLLTETNITNRVFYLKSYGYSSLIKDFFLPEPYFRELTLRIFELMGSFSERDLGQVLSGYIKDQYNNIIKDVFKLLISSSYSVGNDSFVDVDENGFFQAFIQNTIYDDRFIIVKKKGINYDVAFRKYGSPDIIDGTVTIQSPQDLYFEVVPIGIKKGISLSKIIRI